MSFNYAQTELTASRLIAKFGRDVTLTKVTTGSYDINTGSVTNTTTTSTVKCADFAVKGEFDNEGTLIKSTDRYALISGGSATSISTDDKLTIGGVVYAIIAVKLLAPAGVNVLYKAYIRSGQ